MPVADFRREIAEAQMVLVGLGSELDGAWEPELTGELNGSDYAWLIPAYRDFCRKNREGDLLKRRLEKLLEALDGKNYFVISQAQSAAVREMPWREGRLVMPCGGAFRKQCGRRCDADGAETKEACPKLTREDEEALSECCGQMSAWLSEERKAEKQGGERGENFGEKRRETPGEKQGGEQDEKRGETEKELPEEVLRALRMIEKNSAEDRVTGILRKKIPGEFLGRCPDCGAGMILNNVQAPKYDERGYLSDWARYTRWLQGTVNRRLFVLELGVGMEYPGMIRIPFERIVFLNQKAKMYRIHKNLYQITEKLGEKGVGISENAIDWLANL